MLPERSVARKKCCRGGQFGPDIKEPASGERQSKTADLDNHRGQAQALVQFCGLLAELLVLDDDVVERQLTACHPLSGLH